MNIPFSELAFIGPGGPELLVIMLVLLMVFGAKDAPRVFRKINEFMSQLRNTADSFKREIMYSDIDDDSSDMDYGTDEPYAHDEDYNYGDDDYSYMEDEERDYSDETFQNLEKDLERAASEDAGESATPESGDDNVQKA
jgi:sec-independent protein translocase protein TatA